MKGHCDAWSGNCGRTATFVARNEWDGESFEACGHHLGWMLNRYPIKSPTATRFVVVPFNPNVELLLNNSPEGNETPMSDTNIPREQILSDVENNVPRPFQETAGSIIHNYDSGNAPTEQQWDTAALQREFDVLAFGAPLVQVRRKSDGQLGTLEFTHSPRVYFDFRETR